MNWKQILNQLEVDQFSCKTYSRLVGTNMYSALKVVEHLTDMEVHQLTSSFDEYNELDQQIRQEEILNIIIRNAFAVFIQAKIASNKMPSRPVTNP